MKRSFALVAAVELVHLKTATPFIVVSRPSAQREARGGCTTAAAAAGAAVGEAGEHAEGLDPSNAAAYSGKEDTIRVRIWRALASGEELSMTQLSKRVGESRGDVRSHLVHVERQATTIQNKSDDWRVRRGLLPVSASKDTDGAAIAGAKKLRLKKRRGAKNEVFYRLV